MTHRSFRLIIVASALVLLTAASGYAQTPAKPYVPTTDDPMRFVAFAIQMTQGAAGTLDIRIERWTTDAERNELLKLVAVTTDHPNDQRKLADKLQDIKPRVGYIRTSNSMGWDLKYAYQRELKDGTRQIVIATDKPLTFMAVARGARTVDYAISLIEMHFPKGSDKGEGKLLGQSQLSVKDGALQIEIYGQEPTRLSTITQEYPKIEKK